MNGTRLTGGLVSEYRRVEYLRVTLRRFFFGVWVLRAVRNTKGQANGSIEFRHAESLPRRPAPYEQQRTGHAPPWVTVFSVKRPLVITMHARCLPPNWPCRERAGRLEKCAIPPAAIANSSAPLREEIRGSPARRCAKPLRRGGNHRTRRASIHGAVVRCSCWARALPKQLERAWPRRPSLTGGRSSPPCSGARPPTPAPGESGTFTQWNQTPS